MANLQKNTESGRGELGLLPEICELTAPSAELIDHGTCLCRRAGAGHVQPECAHNEASRALPGRMNSLGARIEKHESQQIPLLKWKLGEARHQHVCSTVPGNDAPRGCADQSWRDIKGIEYPL